jgi:hypothetical protein
MSFLNNQDGKHAQTDYLLVSETDNPVFKKYLGAVDRFW